MKRTLLVLASVAALSLGLAPVAHAIGADVRGPACADIVAGDGAAPGSGVAGRVAHLLVQGLGLVVGASELEERG